jgi:hypothetical protein
MWRAVLVGARTAVAARPLVLLLWAYTVALGLAGTLPLARWWGAATGTRPEFDRLLERFDLATVGELTNYDLTSVWSTAVWQTIVVLALGLVAGAWMAGGLLALIVDRLGPRSTAGDSTLAGFGRGAGRTFARYLRLTAYALATVVALVAAVAAATAPAMAWIAEHATPGQRMAAGAGRLAGVALIVGFVWLALDYARIRVMVEPRVRPVRALFGSLWLLLRHPWRTIGSAVVWALVLAAVAAAYLAAASAIATTTWTGIMGLIAVQQIFMVGRSACRVGLMATEVSAYRSLHRNAQRFRPAYDILPPAPADRDRAAFPEPPHDVLDADAAVPGPAEEPVGLAEEPVGPAEEPVGPAEEPVGPAGEPVGRGESGS